MTADTLTDTLTSPAHAPAYPTHWRMARLGDIADIKIGRTPARDCREYWDKGVIPWVAISDLNGSEVRETRERISNLAYAEVFRRQFVPPGTILISFKLSIGKIGVLGIPAVHNEAIASLNLTSSAIDRDYLALYLRVLDYTAYLDTYVKGKTLNKDKLKSLLILLPPLAEQRAIARVLRAAQDAIAARRREVTLERERKAALMQRLFTHGVRGEPTKQTEIGEMPQSWQVVRLGEIAGIERGRFSHRPRNDPEFYGGQVPFIQTGDVTAANGRITTHTQTLNEKGLAVSRVFPKGTIVITIAANIGYTGILELDSAFPDSLIGITVGVDVDVQYLHYYLVTQQPEMDRRAPQGTQKNINLEFLSPWPVLLPPATEQRVIAATLAACDNHIAALEREIALHEELFRALLEELMSGRLPALGLVDGKEVTADR